jgi:ATP-binding cassette subfamily B protein AbcA/BmrA
LTEFLSEILTNIPLVKTFVNEKKEEERGNVCIDKLYKTKFKLSIFTSVFSTVANLTKVLQAIIAIVLGIYLVSKNVITVAVWVAFYLYIDGLWNSINQTINIWTKLKTCQGSARRITEIAMEPSENYQNSLTYEKKNSDICFENVSFKYDQNDILNNLTFKIPDGKVTAIVGPSGAGKTTIFNLLERFYTPDSGSIKRGDVSIDEYQLQDWRKAFGYVSQDTKLFSGTIRDNIAYGLGRKVTDEEIEKAAEAANALEFIKAFDDGFDTQVGEGGSKLSGGQRQRVAIARAILKDPEYLLLDEATSSLDAESEYMVQQALKKLVIGRTTIIIAHRLSTVEDADQIIVIESGKVNGVGNHKNLLENNKLYKQLVEMQLKTEIC